jgi:monovalent cation:proton antiporter-2 (CPA2) family protein
MFDEGWAKEMLIVLATAGLVVPLFGKLRFGVVPGFLIAGVLLGPSGLRRFADDLPFLSAITFSEPERVRPFAELGVLFLLFTIGLEFSTDRLWAMRRLVLGLGSLQFVLSAGLIMAGAGLFGAGLPVALVIGLALALSSTAIVTQVLIEARRFATPAGRVSLGVLIFQDLMVVPIVIIVGLLGGEATPVPLALIRAFGLAAAAIVAIVLAGRYLVRPLLRIAAATGSRELIVAIALFLAIGTALLTAEVGLSAVLGAFLAGLLLGESEYRHQLEVDIEPFKGLLLGLFFMTVGMSFEPAILLAQPVTLIGILVALILAKAIILFGLVRLFRIASPIAAEAALLLAGAGEFAFVVLTLAWQERVLDGEALQFVLAVAALSMIAIPALGFLGRKVGEALADRQSTTRHGVEGADEHEFADHAVIGGFGRVGRMVARLLATEGVQYVALDLDADLVAKERQAGHPVFYGDASRPEILARVGGAKARVFVVTTDEPVASERMVKAIREAWPDAAIHARAIDGARARRLAALGVSGVVPEALEGSLQLASQVLARMGLPDDVVDARIDAVRDEELRRLTEVVDEE